MSKVSCHFFIIPLRHFLAENVIGSYIFLIIRYTLSLLCPYYVLSVTLATRDKEREPPGKAALFSLPLQGAGGLTLA